MDLESIGGGAGAGLIGAILGVFGINRRMNKIEENKQDKSVCEATHKGIEDKYNIMISMQNKMMERLDSLNDFVREIK